MPAARKEKFITLNQSARVNGRRIGQACRSVLRQRHRAVCKQQREKGISERTLQARVREFSRHLRAHTPHWLAEARGMAEAAGLAMDDILRFNALPVDFYAASEPAMNCTSFVAIGKTVNSLFKIRDETNCVQTFSIRANRGYQRIQGGYDIGNLGIAHALNESGVAGANDTGSFTNLVSDEPRLSDCHLLRYLLERAASVDDIPELFEKLLTAKAVGVAGKNRGSLLLFVDARKGLLLECVADDYAVTWLRSGTQVVSNHFLSKKAKGWDSEAPTHNTLIRKERLEKLLAASANPQNPPEVFAFSRDRKHLPHSLCGDDKVKAWMTLSAQYQVIPHAAPEAAVNYVCCGNTRHSLYLPVPLTERRTFLPLLSGEFYRAADRAYQRHQCGTHFRKVQKEFERAEKSADVFYQDALAKIKTAGREG